MAPAGETHSTFYSLGTCDFGRTGERWKVGKRERERERERAQVVNTCLWSQVVHHYMSGNTHIHTHTHEDIYIHTHTHTYTEKKHTQTVTQTLSIIRNNSKMFT